MRRHRYVAISIEVHVNTRSDLLPGYWQSLRALAARGWSVPEECRGAHAILVQSRIRAMSSVLAAATLMWIPVDVAWLGALSLQRSLPLRLGIAAALLLAAYTAPRVRTYVAVHAFLWPQAIGFGLLQWLVDPAHDSALEIGYGLFPFVLVAQLSVLPLPWKRALIAALVPALQLAAVMFASGKHGAALWNDVWLFVLLALVAAWAGHAQLRLLVDLLGARRDAAHDSLTGLPNRRAATQRLEAERKRAMRLGEPLSVLMLDLDRFKQVNDRWGHASGDRVLVAVAEVLRDELRGIDSPSRHGGEEFLAILPNTDAAQAMITAERIRKRIAGLRIDVPAPKATAVISTTISIGVAMLAQDEMVAGLVARADAALYAAKNAGRNCCALAGNDAIVLEPEPAGA